MSGLWNCIAQRWTPQIGDPEATGWLTVLAYLLCAALATVVWRRLERGKARGFWAAIAAVTLFLAVNKQLDLQTALTETGRCLAHAQGWYDQRRFVQLAFFVVLLVGVVKGLQRGKRALSGNLRQNRTALWGVTILGAYVLLRAAGLHWMDSLISVRHFGISLNFVFENTGLALIALNAVGLLRGERQDAAARQS